MSVFLLVFIIYYGISFLLALISLIKLMIYKSAKDKRRYPILYKYDCLDRITMYATGILIFGLIRNLIS